MSHEEQQEYKKRSYKEAIRYVDNAKETLRKAGKEANYYSDTKYVSTACGTAYKGVLLALDAYLKIKGIETTKRKSIECYTENISKIDKKLLKEVNSAYKILHLSGYYDGMEDARVIKTGFDTAYSIIDKINPGIRTQI